MSATLRGHSAQVVNSESVNGDFRARSANTPGDSVGRERDTPADTSDSERDTRRRLLTRRQSIADTPDSGRDTSHSERDSERRRVAGRIVRRLHAVKSLDDLEALTRDEAFWHAWQLRVVDRAVAVFTEVYIGGVEAAVRVMKRRGWFAPRKADPPDEYFEVIGDPTFDAQMRMYVTAYTTEWYGRLEATTRRALVDAIVEARQSGWSIKRTVEEIQPLFGQGRAQRIAVTETTRLFGAGSQHTQRQLGVTFWHWRTAEDDRVDPTCDQMAAGGPYPMTVDFAPAHINCRCWPAPVSTDEQASLEGKA